MLRILAVGLVGLVLVLPASAKDVPVVFSEQEQSAITKDLCEMARYANRMTADQICAYLTEKFLRASAVEAQKAAAEKPAEAPK